MIFTYPKPKNFDLSQIFDCGQAFRFNKSDTKENTYFGVAHSKYIEISTDENNIIFNGVCDEDFKNIWYNYFDFSTDYSSVINSFGDDDILFEAANFSQGIRILKQDKWETLCSFIISQNNNIPRIKGIIENISLAFGEKISCFDSKERYAFPTAKALYEAGVDEIFKLKTGFRAKYIFDAAKKVATGELKLNDINKMDTQSALNELMKINGVGPKVASCVLLFAYSKFDAFPIDVWVKRILENYYKNGISPHLSGSYAGIAQQYLFYYERCKNNVYL